MPFPLLQLPPEIREHIYSFLVTFPFYPCTCTDASSHYSAHQLFIRGSIARCNSDGNFSNFFPSQQAIQLLLVNRQIHEEFTTYVHCNVLFRFCNFNCFRNCLVGLVFTFERPRMWHWISRVEMEGHPDYMPSHTLTERREDLFDTLSALRATCEIPLMIEDDTLINAHSRVLEVKWPRHDLWLKCLVTPEQLEAQQYYLDVLRRERLRREARLVPRARRWYRQKRKNFRNGFGECVGDLICYCYLTPNRGVWNWAHNTTRRWARKMNCRLS